MIYTVIPSTDEQAAIVKFLDHVTRRLNRAIRAKQKVIALLNEQKQVIIHRAVTRGLDPNDPLITSGVPWLGDIPRHWESRKLKYCISPIQQGWSPQCDAQRAGINDWGVLKPVDEQKRMVAILKEDLKAQSSAIEYVARQIGFLQEYRTRLIADVVTGKLDVREAARQIPDDPGGDELSGQEKKFSHEYHELDSGLTEREETDQMNSKMLE